MKKFTLIAASALACAMTANAANLWPIGEALSYGWSTDDATALVSEPGDSFVFKGVLHLTAGKDFKFMTVPDFGNEEYGAAPGASLVDGKVILSKGTNDEGYGKLQVSEDANYLITVDTQTLEATIVKAEYQETAIEMSSLFLVGEATENGWDVMKGTPLYQNIATPYVFSAENLTLKTGEFKIATALKGASSWNGKYWYFRNASDPDKIALDQEGDLKWAIDVEGSYDITVNLKDESISIKKSTQDSIDNIAVGVSAPEYFTLTGIKVENPSQGIFICRQGNKVSKVLVK